jgi:hypothetical protein
LEALKKQREQANAANAAKASLEAPGSTPNESSN